VDKVQLKKLLTCKTNCFFILEESIYLFFLCRVGFKDTTTIETLSTAFPELDMVDHTHRAKLVIYDFSIHK